MLRISIHRPAQIGGQITRISTATSSIIIDLGHNLPNNKGDEDPLDNREAIEALTAGCDAILYTHYHGDHVGLCKHVPSNIPQYIGPIAKRVMECKHSKLTYVREIDKSEDGEKTSRGAEETLASIRRMKPYKDKKDLWFGDIKVTPYFVSHSAADAHMLLIEAEGKKILHTGDFRGHGLLSKGLEPTLNYYIKHVDVLITEGTMLSRSNEKVRSEHKIGNMARDLMRQYKYVFIHCSSTDLERLTVFEKAARDSRPNIPIVTDNFQKEVLNIFSETAGKETDAFIFDIDKIYDYRNYNTKLKNWMKERGFVMFVRATNKFNDFLDDIFPFTNPKQTIFIYSLWDGYITREDTRNDDYIALQKRFQSKEFPATIVPLHTSGHATPETLRKVCEKLRPTIAIIPIHREHGSDFRSIGLNDDLSSKVITHNTTINGIEITFCT